MTVGTSAIGRPASSMAPSQRSQRTGIGRSLPTRAKLAPMASAGSSGSV